MKSLDERQDDAPAPGPRWGVRPWRVGLVAAALAAAAVTWRDVPWPIAVLSVSVLIAVAWSGRDRGPGRTGAIGEPRRRGRTVWPDLGMKTVVDAIDAPCLLVDGHAAVRHANREAVQRFGAIRPGDPLSFRIRITALLDAVDRVIGLARPETVEWHEKIPTERWLLAHLSPIRFPPDRSGDDQTPDFVLILIEDLTERRRVERMRADFVANASHELRTPLAAVTGFIETLQGPARNDTAARETFLKVMAEQAGRMKRLIDDLLSLSRIEMRSHLRPEGIVDLAELLPNVFDLVRPAARAAGVELELVGADVPCPVTGDRDELSQVFCNLVENAVKYGADGGRVVVRLSSPEEDARRVTASVRDFGRGIDPVHLPRLTERFYRAHTEKSGEKRGTGLGLAIVKHIVTRHGGRLSIDSVPGEGSTFAVRLDRPAPPPSPVEKPEETGN
jgi:two-component system phosphate regulon sensor histidine kinase PhoR